jgi:hypothetical protein
MEGLLGLRSIPIVECQFLSPLRAFDRTTYQSAGALRPRYFAPIVKSPVVPGFVEVRGNFWCVAPGVEIFGVGGPLIVPRRMRDSGLNWVFLSGCYQCTGVNIQ